MTGTTIREVDVAILVGALILLVLYFAFGRKATNRPQMLAFLLCLPAVWLLVGIWAIIFNGHQEDTPFDPLWVSLPVLAAPLIFLAASGYFIWKLRRAWPFVIAYAAFNLLFVAYAAMMAMIVLAPKATWP